jgi:hypothetical protein
MQSLHPHPGKGEGEEVHHPIGREKMKTRRIKDKYIRVDVDFGWEDDTNPVKISAAQERVVRQIKRHVDEVLGVQSVVQTYEACSFCETAWDDPKEMDGGWMPLCCDEAQDEAVVQAGFELRKETVPS